jgi:prepilin-type N-terminal cleavage/methylation domain-containing protein
MSARKHRSGFTLVELLVVITIIGMLVALLLPAVQNAREAGRRATCINNLKNITLATQNFESSKQRFPGWREHLGIATQGQSQNKQVKGSWAFMILPQLDRNDLYRAYTKKAPEDSSDIFFLGNPAVPRESLEIMSCPSDPPEQADGAPVSYAVNAGVPDRRHSSEDDAMQTSGDAAANGVFHDADPFFGPGSAVGPNGQPVKPKKLVKLNTSSISANDGTATTIMFAERVEARNWADVGAAAGGSTPYEHDTTQTVLGEHYTGVCWMPVASLPAPASDYDINGIKPPFSETDRDVTTHRYHDVRPSSQHPGIVIVSFVDGHVTTLNETVPYAIYAQLMTPNGSRAVNCDGAQDQPFRLTTPLDENDFK